MTRSNITMHIDRVLDALDAARRAMEGGDRAGALLRLASAAEDAGLVRLVAGSRRNYYDAVDRTDDLYKRLNAAAIRVANKAAHRTDQP